MTIASPTEFDGKVVAKRPRKRIEPLKALRAIRALIADKEDTGQVFKIIDALSGNALNKQFARFAASGKGQHILAQKRSLVAVLSDRAYLADLPEGSLGRTYYEFMAEENLTADGLVSASEEAPLRKYLSDDEQFFGERLRDQHDLWHVTTGYSRDGLGEVSLLAFTYAQTRNRGIGFIALVGARVTKKHVPDAPIWGAVREGYRHGKMAAWLPETDWEAMLPKPLAEVRALLRIEEPALYREASQLTIAAERAGQAMAETKKAA
ncbi:MAG: hypothetical protein K9G30_10050 [Parvibaculum sp.]|nr:hypothetical protein [Parvibaculum sp.]